MLDVREVGREIAHLEFAQINALDEVFHVLRVCQNALVTQADQFFGQCAGVVDKHIQHFLQVFQGRVTVHAKEQLDAFHRQRREQAGTPYPT
ncbi:hypothetical protein D3C86_1667130 [compost metagenome]